MNLHETSFLLEKKRPAINHIESHIGLSVLFSIICIVDVFGVFPIISLPKTIIACGYGGILIVVFVCSVQIYTAHLLGKCWMMAEIVEPSIKYKIRYPYSALAEITYGKRFCRIVTIFVDMTIFGGGIPNLIVASQNLDLLGTKITSGAFHMSFCYWMIVIGIILCPFLWLGSPKDMKLLCTVSVTLVFSVFCLIIACLLLSETDKSNSTNMISNQKYELWQNVFSAYGILVFQFDIHPTILTIHLDMKDKSQISKAIIGAFSVSLTLFAITTIMSSGIYESEITPNILTMLPNSIILYFAAVFVAVQLTLSSAISNTALYQHVEDCMNIPKSFNYRRCLIRSGLALIGILIAEAVPRFDLVMSLIGGALTGPLVFIFPPMLYMKMVSIRQELQQNLQLEIFKGAVVHTRHATDIRGLENCFCILLIAFGIIATMVTTIWNVINAINHVTFTPSCIFYIFNKTSI